jgi:hypothetical protein
MRCCFLCSKDSASYQQCVAKAISSAAHHSGFDANPPDQEIVGEPVRIENRLPGNGEILNPLYRALSNAAGHESRVSTAP